MRKTMWTLIAGTVVAGLLWAAAPQAQTNDEKLLENYASEPVRLNNVQVKVNK